MESYVSPACAIEVLDNEGWPGWMAVDWVSILANVLVSVGLTLSTRKT